MLPNPMRKGWNMLKHGTIIEESTQVSFFEGRFRLLTFEQWHHWCFCWQSNFVHLSPRPRDRKGNSNMTTAWSEELRRWLTGEQCGWLWNVHRAVLGETWIHREHVDDLRVSYSHPQITMCNYSTNTTDVSTYILYMYIYMCRYNVYVYTSDLQISLGWDLFRKIFPANSNCPTFFVCLKYWLASTQWIDGWLQKSTGTESGHNESNLSARITRKKQKRKKKKR